MNISTIVLLLVCVANFLLGLAVFLRNPKSLTMRAFFAISILISLWAVANYLTENAPTVALNDIFNRLAYMFGFWAIAATTIFSASFGRSKPKRWASTTWFYVAIFIAGFLSLTTYVTGSVAKDETGNLHFTVGNLAGIYIVLIIVLVSIITKNFYEVIRRGNRPERAQAKLIALSLVVSIVIGTVTNILIPSLSDSFATAKYGPPLLSLFLVGTVSYAILRHRLFDLRLVIARSVTYILSVGILIISFATVSTLLIRALSAENTSRVTGIMIDSLILAVAVVCYPYVRRFFDRITRNIFYRDAYDPQTFLDSFNKILLDNIELPILLRQANQVIQENLKSQNCIFAVNADGSAKTRIVGTENLSFDEDDMTSLMRGMAQYDEKIVIVEDAVNPDSRLGRLLNSKNIAVVVRLDTSYRNKEDPLAYLLLGPKQSGSLYSRGDLRIIEIIADEMVIAIQNALRFEEIQGFAATLQEKVNQATSKLKRTNDKLKEMDETKDEFISMASHQLRTPLTSVKGYLSMVLEGDVGKISPSQQELLDQAYISSQRMVYLIADLLNVSRLKTGKFIITPTSANLAEIVEGEISQLKEVAKGKKIKVAYDKPNDFPVLMIDETKIRQVIMNFVDNALYYTPAGGKVEVTVKQDKSNVYFTVRDNGMGIPREEQKNLFTKFYRASNARQARPDGTGLGLFMAKKVVVAQGGTILFESTEGKGSTFGFSFPKSKLGAS